MDNASLAAREFRLDPMYVRCGFYVTAGFFLIGCVAIAIGRLLPAGPQAAVIANWLTAILGLLPWHWRLRVDTRGIARRRFLRWDLWPWEDFAAERLKFGYGDRCFVDPARPFWRRKLSLETLTKADSDQVWQWISLVWQPAETTVPEVLEVRVGNFFKRAVRCDRTGIELGSGTRLQRFTWSDVSSLQVDKLRHERADFRRLTLELPGTKLVFFRNQENGVEGRSWSGAEPDVIARYLLAHVPEERQLVLANLDEPITQRELDVRLTRAQKQLRDARRMLWGFGTVLGVFAVGCAIAREGALVIMLPVIGVMYGSIFGYLYRASKSALQELEDTRLTGSEEPAVGTNEGAVEVAAAPSAMPPG